MYPLLHNVLSGSAVNIFKCCFVWNALGGYSTAWNTGYSYHGNIFASDELRCRVTSISFPLAGFFFRLLFIYSGFTNLFFFTAFTLFQELNPYQKRIVFISSYDCFSNTEESMRMYIFHQIRTTFVELLMQKRQIMTTVGLVFFETANSKRFPAVPNFIVS